MTAQLDEFDRASQVIETSVRALGIDPTTVRTQTPNGSVVWSLRRGSASLAVFLRPARTHEDTPFVRAIAPIAKVGGADRTQLFQELLQLNARGLSATAFGLQDETVVVVSERPVRGLDTNEMGFIIATVGTVADHYDDDLCKRLGCAPIVRAL